MSSVSGTESIVYVNVAKRSELLGKGGIVLCFSCVETNILEKNSLAILESSDLSLCVRSDDVVCESNLAVKKLVESVGNRDGE